ncbi:MAG TPA: hypothetical protein VJ549_10070 [Geothrix sp.]|nr:hypothetical protein [Geothrix sp.]
MQPTGVLTELKGEARKDGEGWKIVLALPKWKDAHGWKVVPQGEPLDIQVLSSEPTPRAQWYVDQARWASNRPFQVRISADCLEPVEMQLSYRSNPLHPAVTVVLEVLRVVGRF